MSGCRAPIAGAVACALSGVAAFAQDFPTRSVTIVVPFPAGDGSDAIARLLASHLEQKWSRSVIVDNRPGGSTVIGTTAVARSEPDGYTLLVTAPTLTVVFKATMKNPPLDPERRLYRSRRCSPARISLGPRRNAEAASST